MMYLCLRCNGTGEHEQARDLHRSGGTVPCSDCSGTGKLDERMYQFLKRLGYRVTEEPLPTRSQAEELLAAERAEKEIAERNRDAARENFLTMQKSAAKLLERAEKAEANLEFIERVKGVNEKYANALAFLEMGENDDPEEFAECFWNKFIDLEADNAAQAARINELRELLTKFADNGALQALKDANDRSEYLEAKLAAAEEVAQLVIQAEEDKSGDPNFYILMMQTAYDKARAVLEAK